MRGYRHQVKKHYAIVSELWNFPSSPVKGLFWSAGCNGSSCCCHCWKSSLRLCWIISHTWNCSGSLVESIVFNIFFNLGKSWIRSKRSGNHSSWNLVRWQRSLQLSGMLWFRSSSSVQRLLAWRSIAWDFVSLFTRGHLPSPPQWLVLLHRAALILPSRVLSVAVGEKECWFWWGPSFSRFVASLESVRSVFSRLTWSLRWWQRSSKIPRFLVPTDMVRSWDEQGIQVTMKVNTHPVT